LHFYAVIINARFSTLSSAGFSTRWVVGLRRSQRPWLGGQFSRNG